MLWSQGFHHPLSAFHNFLRDPELFQLFGVVLWLPWWRVAATSKTGNRLETTGAIVGRRHGSRGGASSSAINDACHRARDDATPQPPLSTTHAAAPRIAPPCLCSPSHHAVTPSHEPASITT